MQLMGLDGYRLMVSVRTPWWAWQREGLTCLCLSLVQYGRCEDKLDEMGVVEEGERNGEGASQGVQ